MNTNKTAPIQADHIDFAGKEAPLENSNPSPTRTRSELQVDFARKVSGHSDNPTVVSPHISLKGAQSPMRKWSQATDVYVSSEHLPKWLLYTQLILTTALCFGSYYVYDFPQALQTPFYEV